MKKPIEFNNFPEAIMDNPRWRESIWRFRAVMKEVTDGDTCWFLTDCAFYDYKYLKVRVDGYDAWEFFKGTSEEREKGKLAKEALLKRIPINTPVGLITEQDQSLDRWIATVLYVTPENQVQDIKFYMESEGHTKNKILEALRASERS